MLAWPSLEVVLVTRLILQPRFKSKFVSVTWPFVTMKNVIWIWIKKMKLIHMITNPSLLYIVKNVQDRILGVIFAKLLMTPMIWKSKVRKVAKVPNTSEEIVMPRMEIWVLNGNGDACLLLHITTILGTFFIIMAYEKFGFTESGYSDNEAKF